MKRSAIGLMEINSGDGYELSLKAYQDNVDLVIRTARKYNIPVVANPRLMEILEMLPTNQPVPKQLLPALEIILDRLETKRS